MTGATVALLIVVALLIALVVLVAYMFSQALSKVLENSDRASQRHVQIQSDLLDRFMALDFETFKLHQAASEAPAGEWTPPEEEEPFVTQMSDEEIRRAETTIAEGRRLEDIR